MVKDQDYLKKTASFCIDLAKKLGATDATAVVCIQFLKQLILEIEN